jgi:hypothetical protein
MPFGQQCMLIDLCFPMQIQRPLNPVGISPQKHNGFADSSRYQIFPDVRLHSFVFNAIDNFFVVRASKQSRMIFAS